MNGTRCAPRLNCARSVCDKTQEPLKMSHCGINKVFLFFTVLEKCIHVYKSWIPTVFRQRVQDLKFTLLLCNYFFVVEKDIWTGCCPVVGVDKDKQLPETACIHLGGVWALTQVRSGFLSHGGSGFASVPVGVCPPGVGGLSCHIQTKHKNGHLWPDMEIHELLNRSFHKAVTTFVKASLMPWNATLTVATNPLQQYLTFFRNVSNCGHCHQGCLHALRWCHPQTPPDRPVFPSLRLGNSLCVSVHVHLCVCVYFKG